MKKTATLLLALTLASTVVQARDGDALRVAMDAPYPPFGMIQPDGSLSGFEVELGNAVCQDITNQPCDWVVQAWDGIIPGLLARKYDMIFSSMAITDERKKAVLFSDPYYTTPSAFFVRKSTEFDPDHAKGLRIGVQRATNQDRYVTEFLPDADIVRYTKTDDVALDLSGGRLDAMFVDAPVGIDLAKADGDIKRVGDFIKTPDRIFGMGVGAAFRQRDKALQEKVNASLEKLKKNGVYDRIMDKYFDFNVKL
ncbi:transporter substrate-binding domain-containing protein [Marinobacter mangrovi]|uniref:transporter substrate-binding domain-containing protein n=1 Tax=Marinobacter mangrovi TaxID=2803918 RepID=UPI0019315252|nr:transporter substrate-binding domain-containing protein [Marinobacter mangrovi]